MPELVRHQPVWIQRLEQWSTPLLIIGLLLSAIVVLTWNLGDVPLRDWDEGTIAQVAREIFQAEPGSLRWLYPTLHGEPYLNKPTLMHSLIAVLYRVGGVQEWTSRLPGAMLTAASVPLLFAIGREVFVCRTPAVIGALVYLTMLPIARHGRLAMLDGAVLCFFLLLIWCALRSRRDPRWGVGIGVALGLITLTKGIIAVPLGAIALSFLVWDSPRLLTSVYLWMGLALGSLPAVGWYSAQWFHYGSEFLNTHVLDQSFSRIWNSVDNNTGPPWYYVLELLKYAWPWLMFVPIAFRMAWRSRTLSWAKLVLVWSGIYFAVISVMSTKLPWYILPLYPALALAIAVPLSQLWQHSTLLSDGERPPDAVPRWWIGWFMLMAIAGWVGSFYFGQANDPVDPGLQLVLASLGLTMTVVSILTIQGDRQFISVLIWGTYVSLCLLMTTPHWLWELNEDYPVQPVANLVQQVPKTADVFTSHHGRPSLNFYSDRRVIPAARRLQHIWDNRQNVYLLVDDEMLETLDTANAHIVGSAEGWTLITRSVI
jgi:4-amino-4-deoxy-L-arabinose transferase-like glycosyltransferase